MSAWQRPTAKRTVLAGGLLALALTSIVFLAHSAPRRAGTNLTAAATYAIPLGPGQQLCEPGELLPADTGALEVGAQVQGSVVQASAGRGSAVQGPAGPPLQASLRGPRGQLSSGTLGGGWHTGRIRIPVSRLAGSTGGTVCLRNQGRVAVAFAGSLPDSGFTVQVAGQTLGGRLRIDYLRPGSESWLELAPTLAYRLSLAKSDLVRHWAAEGALLLMLIAVTLAVATIAREESS
jgi:hypothetical protein